MKYRVLKSNEPAGDWTIYQPKKFGLDQWNQIVGGYIELVAVLYKNKRCTMIVNETGAIQDGAREALSINAAATEIYHAASRARGEDWIGPPYIHGNVILFDGSLP